MDGVCKHFRTVYCKFGEVCQRNHVKEICQIENCHSDSCSKRNPKICKYFHINQFCKFGKDCSYLHIISKEKSDITDLNHKVNELQTMILNMTHQIDFLKSELEAVKQEKETSSTALTSEKIFKCEICEYSASTNTVLKRHMTMKHKNKVQSSQIPCDRSNKGCQNVVGRRNGNWAIVCDECSQFLSNKLKASPFSQDLCIGCHDHPTSGSFIFCSECSDWLSNNPDGLYESQWGVWMPDQDNPGIIMCYDLDHDGKL